MRALRYNLQIAVRFRPVGESQWRDGVTQNVSSSGVLFHAAAPVDPSTPLEMRLALPVGRSPAVFSQVVCNGRIVRTVAPSRADDRTGFAVAISNYELVPVKQGES